MKWTIFTLAVAIAGCKEPNPPTCEGQGRPQLNCESEFKYDGRKIEGGFTALGVGNASGKTEEQALRAIDKETEQYAAQSRRLCDEYNKCVVDKETYATRSENLRRRMSKVPDLYDAVKAASDDTSRRKALSRAYTAIVPDESRRELALDLLVEAQRPSDASPRVIAQGEKLPTGTKVDFVVRPSSGAHVYLFQRSPDGKIAVLFPDDRIPTKNPLKAGATLRIPPGDRGFKLNDKDIGTERVYVVASLDPIARLEQTLAKAESGPPAGALAQVTEAKPADGTGGCARALELDDAAPKCTRSRGLVYDDAEAAAPATKGAAPAAPASVHARTEAADSVIVQVFSFEHTP